MRFIPNSVVKLLNVPLSADNKNQLSFSDATAQANYFSSCAVSVYSDLTYQRKDFTIRVPQIIDALWSVNYCMYQNSNFSGKWFYAFVTKMEYINDNMTLVYLKTDVFQTWIFNTTFYDSFVEREHVSDDTFGLHTINEGLPISDYITQLEQRINSSDFCTADSLGLFSSFFDNYYLVLAMSEQLKDNNITTTNVPTMMGGIPTPIFLYGTTSLMDMYAVLNHVNISGQGSAVINLYSAPKNYVTLSPSLVGGDKTNYPSLGLISDNIFDTADSITISKPSDLNGYVPKNNKCFCYPYSMLELSNNNESVNGLKFENGTNGNINLHGQYVGGINASYTCYPKNYEGNPSNYLRGVSFQNFPQIAWNYNSYENYVALNKNSIVNSVIQTGVSAGVQMLTGNVMGGLMSATSNITGMLAKFEDMKNIPETTKNLQQPEVSMFIKSCGIYARRKTIRAEFAIIIDKYFSQFGYKVSTFKTPQFNSRPNWNYIETKDINIKCNAPQNDIIELQNIFNTGVTIWHNPATFGDYSQNNEL